MILSKSARCSPLAALPTPQVEGSGRAAGRPGCLFDAAVWDGLLVPPHIDTRLPRHLVAVRTRLKAHFKSQAWDLDAAWTSSSSGVVWIPAHSLRTYDAWRGWLADQRQQLVRLIQQITYTRALVEGPYRVFLEYRPGDKTPHYRLLWQGVFFGRANLYVDTDREGANGLASQALALVQQKLAAYLHLLGCRADAAALRPQAVHSESSLSDEMLDNFDIPDAVALMKSPREAQLFTTNIEHEIQHIPRERMPA